MYVETIKKKQGKKTYRTFLVRESYKENGKVRHRTIANISKLPSATIAQIKAILSRQGSYISSEDLEVSGSREYGASASFLALARLLGIDKLLYSRREQWREDLMALIVGRIVYQGSKLHLSNLYMDSTLWELCGHPEGKPVDVREHCYSPMDRLLERQKAVQSQLAKRHLQDGCMILYDMTNTWFEGEYEDSEIVTFGIGKGGKKGYKQIAVGLVTNKLGCPVAVEVFSGNTSDQTTVRSQVERLADEYGIKEIVFTGDRGMLTPKRIKEVNELGFRTLTSLTHPQVFELLKNNVIQPELFDEREIAEVFDPDNPEIRYMLCKNPETANRERKTRNSLIEVASLKLEEIAAVKRKRQSKKVCARVGVLLAKYKVSKFFKWQVSDTGKLDWELNVELVEKEEAIDGCYIIRTDASPGSMDKNESVTGYKSLAGVEKAFRNLKTVLLELRPVYHKRDDRIKAHVFLCMLAYYVQWHAMELLTELFENDGEQADRRWSMQIVIERLKSIRKTNVNIGNTRFMTKITKLDPEQKTIVDLLGVKIE